MTNENDPVNYQGRSGLTKREYFAAMAMQGFIAAGVNGMPETGNIAKYAVDTADALIKTLNEPQS